jgi:hypothetical protein
MRHNAESQAARQINLEDTEIDDTIVSPLPIYVYVIRNKSPLPTSIYQLSLLLDALATYPTIVDLNVSGNKISSRVSLLRK